MLKILYLVSFVLLGNFVFAQKLTPVDAGSKVQFTIKNFGINTNGQLSGLKGDISFDFRDPNSSFFDITVDAATINTDNNKRDNHLRASDFFDVANHPVMRISGKAAPVAAGGFLLKGSVTIKNISKAIDIPFTAVQQGKGILFEGSFKLNRLDFKIGGQSATMSDEVSVRLKVLAQ